jgi:hypothetical protein
MITRRLAAFIALEVAAAAMTLVFFRALLPITNWGAEFAGTGVFSFDVIESSFAFANVLMYLAGFAVLIWGPVQQERVRRRVR